LVKVGSNPQGSGKRLVDLRHQIHHAAVGAASLGAVLSDLLHQRGIGDRIEHGVAAAGVEVAAPQEVRHHEDVVLLPLEALAGDLGFACAFDHRVHRARGLALGARLLARPQEARGVRPIIVCSCNCNRGTQKLAVRGGRR
jgi:hypothetical protein